MRILRNLAYFAAGVFLAASFMLGTTHVRADHPYRERVAATVHLVTGPNMSCSAVMIAPERALTAAHCLGMDSPVMTVGETDYPVLEGYAAGPRDVAILIVPGAPCPCATVAETQAVEGAPVTTVGYPFGVIRMVTYGELQGHIVDPSDGQEYIVVTTLGAPGNSGGGVFDANGDLIGIVSKGAQGVFLLAVELFTMTIPVK